MAEAGDDGDSKPDSSGSPNGGYDKFRGRGNIESHGGERSVRPRSSRDEYRNWLHARNKPPKNYERFVIVSYNILADVNARTHWNELYWHIPPFIMNWNARKRKLLWELKLWSPDIMCLQEVDRYDDFNEELQKEGYVGVYQGRTGSTRDGCAMFWRENRFELLEEESIEFKDHNLRDNVAQLCVLQTKSKTIKRNDKEGTEDKEGTADKEDKEDTGPTTSGSCDSKSNRVVVGNIHVLFNPKRGDVKLGQARVLLEKAHALSEKWGNVPVAIAGDFNSTPGSPLYRFISSSQLDLAGCDRRYISGQEEEGENEGSRTNGHSKFNYERKGTASRSYQAPDARGGVGSGAGDAAGDGAEAEEELVLDSESSIMSMKKIDSEESTMISTGVAYLATEIIHKKTTRVSIERISKRIRGWDPFELMAATGWRHLSVVQHKLNLRSAYSEIEGKPGSRDERGEPLVTTFHRKFRGTVDYIWHTDDLCTVRVLDTLPTSVLQLTKGLPSKKWGSDHLALACELSFLPRKDTDKAE